MKGVAKRMGSFMSTRTRYALIFVFCAAAANHDKVLPFLKSLYKKYFRRQHKIMSTVDKGVRKEEKDKAARKESIRKEEVVRPKNPDNRKGYLDFHKI